MSCQKKEGTNRDTLKFLGFINLRKCRKKNREIGGEFQDNDNMIIKACKKMCILSLIPNSLLLKLLSK